MLDNIFLFEWYNSKLNHSDTVKTNLSNNSVQSVGRFLIHSDILIIQQFLLDLPNKPLGGGESRLYHGYIIANCPCNLCDPRAFHKQLCIPALGAKLKLLNHFRSM